MQATLFETETVHLPKPELLWLRAAIRECIEYGDHGVDTEEDEHGNTVCFNCQGSL